MKQFLLRALVGAALVSPFAPVIAADHAEHGTAAAKAASQPLSEGTIKRIDRAAGSVTLSHGPIDNLGMSAMTMSFVLKKGAAAAALKDGDKVRFRAEEKDGNYIVVRLEAAK